MDISKENKHQPTCLLSHYFINKLTVIIGNCQLLEEKAENSDGFISECKRRLTVVQEIAKGMTDELKDHNCRLDAMAKVAMLAHKSAASRFGLPKKQCGTVELDPSSTATGGGSNL